MNKCIYKIRPLKIVFNCIICANSCTAFLLQLWNNLEALVLFSLRLWEKKEEAGWQEVAAIKKKKGGGEGGGKQSARTQKPKQKKLSFVWL